MIRLVAFFLAATCMAQATDADHLKIDASLLASVSPSQPLPVVDGMIAATGLEYQLIVVTRNVTDFQRSGANTLNPFN